MREEIQQLISEGRTEEALVILAKLNGDAVLLQARYNQAKKQQNMGLIDFSEFSRAQAQINFAALDMAGTTKSSGSTIAATPAPAIKDFKNAAANDASANKKVFISYNHKDKEIADRVKEYLEKGGLEVTIDREKMEPGQSISDFIKNNIRSNGYILSLVSQNSLRSGWVGMESTASLFAEWIADKHFLPLDLDGSWYREGFYVETLTYINESVKNKEKEARTAKKLGGRTTHIESQIERLLDLKANLSSIIERLQSVLTVPISNEKFEDSMEDVLNVIKKN
jgi:hypothetical protein